MPLVRIILEDVNDPHEEYIRVKYWMPYQTLGINPSTGAIAPTCERNALVHRSNMMFLEPKGEFSENAWNQKVSWANLCWHIRGERLQNPTTSAVMPVINIFRVLLFLLDGKMKNRIKEWFYISLFSISSEYSQIKLSSCIHC